MRHAHSPLFPVTITLVMLSLGLFGYGAFLHVAPKQTAAATPAHAKTPLAKKHTKTVASPAMPVVAGGTEEVAFRFLLGGGVGLFLSALCGLALSRQQPVAAPAPATSMRSAQSLAWEKQREDMETQRQQLQAQLLEAQRSKADMDSQRQNASRQFQEFFRTLPVACFCFAADGKIVRWNAACEALYGVSTAEAMAGTLWGTLVPPEGRDVMEAWIGRVLAGESLLDVERIDRAADGAALLVRSSMVPLLDATGGIIGGLSASINVSMIRQQEGRAADLNVALQETLAALEVQRREVARLTSDLAAAQTVAVMPEETPMIETERDVVTGLCGRDAFHERLRIETDRAGRYHTSLSVMMMDLDGFTQYNQTLTTDAGDAALKAVAGLIEHKLRTVDVATRYGADEYGLILPETGQTGAGVAAERLRSGIAGLAWPKQPLTACYGIAMLTPDVSSPEELAARAAEALRCAKSLGANIIVHHGEMPSVPPSAMPPKRPRATRTKKTEVGVS